MSSIIIMQYCIWYPWYAILMSDIQDMICNISAWYPWYTKFTSGIHDAQYLGPHCIHDTILCLVYMICNNYVWITIMILYIVAHITFYTLCLTSHFTHCGFTSHITSHHILHIVDSHHISTHITFYKMWIHITYQLTSQFYTLWIHITHHLTSHFTYCGFTSHITTITFYGLWIHITSNLDCLISEENENIVFLWQSRFEFCEHPITMSFLKSSLPNLIEIG